MWQLVKHALFACVAIMLLLPAVQRQWQLIALKPLKGDIRQPAKPELSLRSFWQASYQSSMNVYVEHNIGFRPLLVRLNNQLHYSLFKKAFAKGVVVGKSGYLYESDYIHSVTGDDFAGHDRIRQFIDETAAVNNWFIENNKHLLIVITPGKGSFFPEFIPDHYPAPGKKPTNYQLIADGFIQNDIPLIDINKWFQQIKQESPYALFPKLGIHWSQYGVYLAFDSIIKVMAEKQGAEFIDFGYDSVVVTDDVRPPDRDIWEGMNLICKPKDYPMPYPSHYFRNAVPDKMPDVLVVSDSFYWQFFGTGYATRVFKNHSFWYYNNTIFSGKGGESRRARDVDLLGEILQTDFVIVMQTEGSLYRYSFGFISDIYKLIREEQED